MRKRDRQSTGDPYRLRETHSWGPLEDLKPGEVVSYTAAFCRQLGFTGGDRRGVFVGPHPEIVRWVLVQWNDSTQVEPVSLSVLARPGPNLRFGEAL